MQELWDDKSFRLGAHGIKNHRGDIEYSRTVMNGIFTKGLITSQHQIGQTDLKYTVKVQGYNPTATGDEYVLPEYVLGYVPQDEVVGTKEYFRNRQIIFNTEKKRAKYKYFFENGSKGKRIEFEERGIEE